MSQAKNSSTLEIPLFLQDFAVVVAVVIKINSIIGGFRWFMIGYFNCPITRVQLQPTVRLQQLLYTVISEK